MLETPENLNTQAIELASQGYYKEAVACLNRAITIDKKNYLLWYNLGITYRDMGKQRDAKKAFLQAYELNYIDEDLLESLSLISFSLNDLEDAFRFCYEGLDLNPTNHHCWNNLGVFNFSKKDYEEAATSFETALSIYPHFYDALYNLRDTYLELGNKEGAKECTRYMQNIKSSGTLYG